MKPHPDKALLDKLFPAVREYQALAVKHGIKDIFKITVENFYKLSLRSV